MLRFAFCAIAGASSVLASACHTPQAPAPSANQVPARGVAAASPASPAVTAAVAELTLRAALEMVSDEPVQPSGLALAGGRLLMVSDKQDNVVYEVELGQNEARLRPFALFDPPSGEPPPLDYEGIAVAVDGALLVASESRLRALRVDVPAAAEGTLGRARASWLTPSLRDVGQAAGLFVVANAYLEGLTPLPAALGGGLLLAAERDPRGLIQLNAQYALAGAEAWSMPKTAYPLPAERGPDFCDLTLFDGRVYALARNAHLVVELERAAQGWQEKRTWSYARAENDPRFAYADTRYGLAEGLALSDSEIYIALDNNDQARRSAPNDRRPLLFVFERPRN